MKKLLIIGGNSGISEAFIEKHAKNYEIIALNRSGSVKNNEIKCYKYDALTDELPFNDTIDGLVYFPGSINLKPFKSLSIEDFKNDFEINLLGAVKTIQQALSLLNKNGSSIVLFSTVAVNQGMSFHSSIASAKGAIEGLTKSLAAELAPHVRVNCIAPSITDTPLAKRILGNEKALENAKNRHPLKKVGTSENLADAVEFLINDSAKWITGQVLNVDGGLSNIKSL